MSTRTYGVGLSGSVPLLFSLRNGVRCSCHNQEYLSLPDLSCVGLLWLDINTEGGRQDYLTSESKVGEQFSRILST